MQDKHSESWQTQIYRSLGVFIPKEFLKKKRISRDSTQM